jgi:hypothetical protein
MTPQQKWNQRNKEKLKLTVLRSNTKSFINNHATKEELENIIKMAKEKMSEFE